jgi:hypothetical protein
MARTSARYLIVSPDLSGKIATSDVIYDLFLMPVTAKIIAD